MIDKIDDKFHAYVKLDDESKEYFIRLGRIAVASAQLEDMARRTTGLFYSSMARLYRINAELERLSLFAKLQRLFKLVDSNWSDGENKKAMLAAIRRADQLRRLRNENLHAVWRETYDRESGAIAGFMRFAAGHKYRTPTMKELEQLADEIIVCSAELMRRTTYAWKHDPDVRKMRDRRLVEDREHFEKKARRDQSR